MSFILDAFGRKFVCFARDIWLNIDCAVKFCFLKNVYMLVDVIVPGPPLGRMQSSLMLLNTPVGFLL